MRVSYLYDLALPAPLAAPIQILSTCRALAAAGVPTTVFTGRLNDDPTACLAFYGLEPHARLELRQLFSQWSWRLQLPWRLARVTAYPRGTGPCMVLTRGESGVNVFDVFTRKRRRKVFFIYEAHRLCFAHLAERLSGKRWREGAILPARVLRLRERERAVVEGADAVICLTEGVRQALAASFKLTQPTLVLPSGTSLPAVPALTSAAQARDIDVLYIGKLAARKGVSLLIDAMRHLPERRLTVVGGTPVEVAVGCELAEAQGLGDRIDFAGFVEPRQVRDYLARARVGVCPLPTGSSITSELFTSPMKLLEMIAHGIPVVASELPSTRAMVTHGHSALLVAPDDAVVLAGAIRSLLDDPALARRLAIAGRQRAAEFSWQERARRLKEFLERVAKPSAKNDRATTAA